MKFGFTGAGNVAQNKNSPVLLKKQDSSRWILAARSMAEDSNNLGDR